MPKKQNKTKKKPSLYKANIDRSNCRTSQVVKLAQKNNKYKNDRIQQQI